MSIYSDEEYLRQAVDLKRQSKEPVPCACILVRDGKVLASTINSQRADNVAVHHAEVKAIYQANRATGERKLKGTTAYCSCEPCAMCLGALSVAGVERIVYAERMQDVAPHDPLSRLDSKEFVTQYFKNAPKLERLVLS